MARMERRIEIGSTLLSLAEGDITTAAVGAVVNAANSSLLGGGGVDGAIHRGGGPTILEECRAIRRESLPDGLPPGQVVLTTGGNLPADHVIHTVGPIFGRHEGEEPRLLASCHSEALHLAADRGIPSVAFPSISTGAYGYPMDEAARIALEAVVVFVKANPSSLDEVRFVLFGDRAYQIFSHALDRMSDLLA